jgi:hypothetical protein
VKLKGVLDTTTKRRNKARKLLGGVCVDCGTTSNLQFHHKDPNEKTRNMAGLWKFSWSTIEKELKKCELICSTCHMLRHRGSDFGVSFEFQTGKWRATVCIDYQLYRLGRYVEKEDARKAVREFLDKRTGEIK